LELFPPRPPRDARFAEDWDPPPRISSLCS
jgi:hypothetical protein